MPLGMPAVTGIVYIVTVAFASSLSCWGLCALVFGSTSASP
jgi:hypothetical protein